MTSTRPNGPSKRSVAALAVALAALVLLAGCGSSNGGGAGDPGSAADAPDFSKVAKDAPKQLAPLYADGGKLVGGGKDAYDSQLAELKGYPVVVNKWASWCGPCREEVPYLQSAVAKRGDKVAFMGIDANDTDAAAQTYIRDHPIPYLSFTDANESLSDSLGAAPGQPITIFYNSAGDKTYMHSGPYASLADLNADIDKYAVNG